MDDLFYNLPARRKFLKSDSAESAQVSRIVTQLSLAYPEVGFSLTSGGRKVLACPPAGSFHDRLYQVYGDRTDLIEVKKEAGGLRVTGYVAALADQGPTRGPQNVFINRRIVKDRTIAHAIIDAYSVASIKERSPEVHLFIEMPLEAVDVNVHPTKAEVRFRDQSLVHEVVRRALMDALGQGGVPQLQLRPENAVQSIRSSCRFRACWAAGRIRIAGCRRDTARARGRATGVTPLGRRARSEQSRRQRTAEPRASRRHPADDSARPVSRHLHHRGGRRGRGDHRSARRARTRAVRAGDGAADVADRSNRSGCSCRSSSTCRRPRIRRWSVAPPELERLGFEIESFGAGTIKVSAVPALLKTEDSSKALLALAEDLEGLDRGAQVQDALQRIAATTACHAAVKANYPLTYEKMAHILDELRATAYSTVCPHGRPVMLRLTRREIEKNFDRI